MNTNPDLSFEFFPPRTPAGTEKLQEVHAELNKFNPNLCSVTYGAGGSTQEGTFDAVKMIRDDGSNAVPHLTGIGTSREQIKNIVTSYIELGVDRLVILRGDLPGGMVERGHFKYAEQLITFIRDEFGDELNLEVAAYPDFHPESPSPLSDLLNFKRKIDAGANSAITQYFYNADSYFAYLDEAHRLGIDVPIVPGVMPITNYTTLMRFSDTCGADIPNWIRARLMQYQNDEASLKSFGLDVVTHLCLDLLDNNVPGLHFYALNKVDPNKDICTRIGYQQAA